jgi:hypothetical protein
MEFVSLETKQEADNFLSLCNKNMKLLNGFISVGAVTLQGKSTDQWYWVNSGKRINYPIAFLPGEPNFLNDLEFCLSVVKNSKDIFMFNDTTCNDPIERQFICEKIDYHSVTGL